MNPTILIIDDSAQNLDIITQILKNDYTIKVSNSAQKALTYLQSGKKIDLILLDILMPEMDGYELCTLLKADDALKEIPVIFLSALEKEDDMLRGLKLGAVDYVIKPVSPPILKARVATHVKLKQFQDALKEDLLAKEQLLMQQSKMAILGEMLENIVHQWKQPISMISISSSNIRIDRMFGNLDLEGLDKALDAIESAVEHLSQTMDDFRDFLHEESEAQTHSLKTILEQSLMLMESKLHTSSVKIDVDVEDISIKLFKNDLIQILMNILSNSVDALAKKEGAKKIRIHLTQEQEQVKLTLCDNAGGIKEELLEKIFEKYFTTKEQKKGSGIGLYMCRILATKRLKGAIGAYNTQEGACFEIALPKNL